jgi:hypothetical protein
MWNPRLDEHSDIFRYTTEELCSIATQYTTSNEPTELHLALGSRVVTPSSSKDMPSDVVVESAMEGSKGGKKRRKQCPKGGRDYDRLRQWQ